MFLPLNLRLEFRIEHVVTIWILYAKFLFAIGIFYKDFHTLKLIVLVVFGAVDKQFVFNMLIHLLVI